MKRPQSNILPLLAGRLRPQRKAPRAGGVSAAGPVLRISQRCDSENKSGLTCPGVSTAPSHRGSIANPASVDASLQSAESAIDEIRRHLLEIEGIWRHFEPEDGVQALPTTSQLSRTADAGTRGAQLLVDRHVAAIEKIARETEYDGTSLFDGRWSISIELEAGAERQTFNLPRISVDSLGNEKIAGVVASLKTDEDFSIESGESATARAIIRCALIELSGYRERIESFLHHSMEACSLVREIAEENAEAVNESMNDADFVRVLGSITRMDALLAVQSMNEPRNFCTNPTPSVLRISPIETSPPSDNS